MSENTLFYVPSEEVIKAFSIDLLNPPGKVMGVVKMWVFPSY